MSERNDTDGHIPVTIRSASGHTRAHRSAAWLGVDITGSGNNVATNSSNVSQTTTVKMTEENSRQLPGLAESLAQLTSAGLLQFNDEKTREAALVVQSSPRDRRAER